MGIAWQMQGTESLLFMKILYHGLQEFFRKLDSPQCPEWEAGRKDNGMFPLSLYFLISQERKEKEIGNNL